MANSGFFVNLKKKTIINNQFFLIEMHVNCSSYTDIYI